jgi:hypothetical protein
MLKCPSGVHALTLPLTSRPVQLWRRHKLHLCNCLLVFHIPCTSNRRQLGLPLDLPEVECN